MITLMAGKLVMVNLSQALLTCGFSLTVTMGDMAGVVRISRSDQRAAGHLAVPELYCGPFGRRKILRR
jgi:hypothetical protein